MNIKADLFALVAAGVGLAACAASDPAPALADPSSGKADSTGSDGIDWHTLVASAHTDWRYHEICDVDTPAGTTDMKLLFVDDPVGCDLRVKDSAGQLVDTNGWPNTGYWTAAFHGDHATYTMSSCTEDAFLPCQYALLQAIGYATAPAGPDPMACVGDNKVTLNEDTISVPATSQLPGAAVSFLFTVPDTMQYLVVLTGWGWPDARAGTLEIHAATCDGPSMMLSDSGSPLYSLGYAFNGTSGQKVVITLRDTTQPLGLYVAEHLVQ